MGPIRHSRGGLADGGPEFRDDGFLGGFHGGAFGRIRVLVAGEMEEAVDEVAQDFAGERFAVFGGLALGDFGADDDLAVVEGDHVGGALDVHEIAVDPVAGGIVHEGDFERGEMGQRRVVARRRVPRRDRPASWATLFQGGEPVFRDFGGFLVVADDDFERHEVGFSEMGFRRAWAWG